MSDITEQDTTTHRPVKVGYLVTGLVFIGLAGSWALRESGAVDDMTVGWMLPAILVGAGVIGLLAMLAGGVRDRGRTERVEPTSTTDLDPDTHEEDR
jgi:hypothetical protein